MPSKIYQVRAQDKLHSHPQSFFCSNQKEAARFRKQIRKEGYKVIETVVHLRPFKKADILKLLNSIS